MVGPLDDLNLFAWMLAAVGGLLALQYILGPILIRYTQKMRGSPHSSHSILKRSRPRPTSRHSSTQLKQNSGDHGFEALAHVALPNVLANVKSIVVVMVRPESNDAAMAATMFGTGGGTTVEKFHVEFSTDFADGIEVATTNSKEESVFRPLPHKKLLQCDFARDPVGLWRIHDRATREFGTGSKVRVPGGDEVVERFAASLRKEFTDQVAVGWLYYDEEHDVFRLTWKGACLMTWKICWPVAQIRRAPRRKRVNRLLEE